MECPVKTFGIVEAFRSIDRGVYIPPTGEGYTNPGCCFAETQWEDAEGGITHKTVCMVRSRVGGMGFFDIDRRGLRRPAEEGGGIIDKTRFHEITRDGEQATEWRVGETFQLVEGALKLQSVTPRGAKTLETVEQIRALADVTFAQHQPCHVRVLLAVDQELLEGDLVQNVNDPTGERNWFLESDGEKIPLTTREQGPVKLLPRFKGAQLLLAA